MQSHSPERLPLSGWRLVLELFSHPRLAVLLKRALKRHRRMEKDFVSRVRGGFSFPDAVRAPFLEMGESAYLSRNVFSILVLSFLDFLDVPEDRIRAYGMLTHALRGIVTSSDNILDKEDKGALVVEMKGGRVLSNIYSILFHSGMLDEVFGALIPEGVKRKRVRKRVMDALYEVAREESADEKPFERVLEPQTLLDTVHRYRGGALLQLAFVVPLELEQEKAASLDILKRGMHDIGVAVQCLDDVTDLAIDLEARNHNLLYSWIVKKHPDGEVSDEAIRRAVFREPGNPERIFPRATAEVVRIACRLAQKGFAAFESAGYPIRARDVTTLMRFLFEVRGVGALWRLREDVFDGETAVSHEGRGACGSVQ
jgi:hypothetical protein